MVYVTSSEASLSSKTNQLLTHPLMCPCVDGGGVRVKFTQRKTCSHRMGEIIIVRKQLGVYR